MLHFLWPLLWTAVLLSQGQTSFHDFESVPFRTIFCAFSYLLTLLQHLLLLTSLCDRFFDISFASWHIFFCLTGGGLQLSDIDIPIDKKLDGIQAILSLLCTSRGVKRFFALQRNVLDRRKLTFTAEIRTLYRRPHTLVTPVRCSKILFMVVSWFTRIPEHSKVLH
jgi:hypothetical protein